MARRSPGMVFFPVPRRPGSTETISGPICAGVKKNLCGAYKIVALRHDFPLWWFIGRYCGRRSPCRRSGELICLGSAVEIAARRGLLSREGIPDGVHTAFRRVCSGGVITACGDATLLKTPRTIVELQLTTPCARAEWYHDGAGVSVHLTGCVGRRTIWPIDRRSRKLVKYEPCYRRHKKCGVDEEPGDCASLVRVLRSHGSSPGTISFRLPSR